MSRPETMRKTKLYVCATAQTATLNRAAFEALTWVQVKNVGSVTGMGTNPNIVNYNTLDDDVVQKAKGIVDGGSWEVEVAYVFDDAGQIIMRTAAATDYEYAFKLEYENAPSAAYTNTIVYNKGLVAGPRRPGGRGDDFILEQYTIAMNQTDITVDAALI